MSMALQFLNLLLSYALGNCLFAIIVCRLFHLPDPRTVGSLNPGTTNVSRLNNHWATVLTLIGDTCKTILPYQLSLQLGFDSNLAILSAFSAHLGHIFPVFTRGGRGVATAFGFFVNLTPMLSFCFAGLWTGSIYVLGDGQAGKSSFILSMVWLCLLMCAPFHDLFTFSTIESSIAFIVLMTVIWTHKDKFPSKLTLTNA